MVLLASALALSATAPALMQGAAPALDGATWGFSVPKLSSSATPAVVDPGVRAVTGGSVAVIVTATAGTVEAAAASVTAGGGTVGERLPLVDGFAASLPADAVDGVAASGAVQAITLDRRVEFEEVSYDETSTASKFAVNTGATRSWANARLGEGVGVAVIDTGVSPMPDFEGRLVHGPDLSGEGRTIDTYGHGTVMAGLVGGSGKDSAGRVGGAYTGVAPKSTIIAVKAAGRNGVTDVSTMLQAMHWVSAYKDQFNIRVLNLSWGTSSTQSPAVDPLNHAVQRLWKQGIVVVVAAGNSGPTAGTIMKPGDDPLVITAGAYDDKADVEPRNDALTEWTSRGPTAAGVAKPDVVAPGRTVVSARSLGSHVETNNPKALLAPSYIKGSGTSQAAAVTSGVVALLLQARPDLTPDQVKAVLKGAAVPIAGKTVNEQGAGRLQLAGALTAAAGPATQQSATATGLGSLELSRGGRNVKADCNGDGIAEDIIGEIDVRCEAWNGAAWTGAAWTGAAWTGAAWTGAAWTGAAWTGAAWTGAAWTGAAWTGAAWTGGTWTGAAWTGAAWTGAAWTGSAWTGAAWTGAAWTGAAWTGAAWTGSEYTSTASDEQVSATGYLTSFWSDHPKYFQKVPGERSHPAPPGCTVDSPKTGQCRG
jgi:serine protease AprX